MMENRSYDHYLGARAFEGKPGDGLVAGMSNPDPDGNPIEIWPATPALMEMCVADPPHGWDASRTQMNGGVNDGFVLAHMQAHADTMKSGLTPMQYMTRDIVPVTNALADEYTICDRWFCSVLGPTLPNRMYWHAATSNGAKANSEVIQGAFEGVTSLYHRLEAAGIDWAYYYFDVPVLGVLQGVELEGRLRRYMYDFIDEAAAGTLPPVVYIDPGFAFNDDHPPHHPFLGQQLLASTYQALATSPQWKNCLLVVTYDENGGFYDHVAPPTAPDALAAQGFDQLGFRVPTLVVGPYAKQSYVSSVQYDHTSALAHVERHFGLEPMTMRDAAANDLTDCLDEQRLAAGTTLTPITVPAVEIDFAMLPDFCKSPGDITRELPHDHDILEWAAVDRRLRRYVDMRRARDDVFALGDYLDRHNLGRIRRR
jgi:phospholipase C